MVIIVFAVILSDARYLWFCVNLASLFDWVRRRTTNVVRQPQPRGDPIYYPSDAAKNLLCQFGCELGPTACLNKAI